MRDKTPYEQLRIAINQGDSLTNIESILTQIEDKDINQVDQDDHSLLNIAIFAGYTEAIKLLLKHKDIDLNLPEKISGATPLFVASQSGNANIVKILLEDPRTDPNLAKTTDGITPFFTAAQNGHANVVELLLKDPRTDIYIETNNGWNPLMIAAQNGHKNVVKHLLADPGIELNKASNKNGATPLFIAAQEGHEDVVKLLLKDPGIEVNQARINDGATPLHYAAQNGHENIVRHLLTHENIAVNQVTTNDKKTPLYHAVRKDRTEVVNLLLADERTRNLEAPLYLLAQQGNLDGGRLDTFMRLLADERTNPNKVVSRYTPLHMAALKGSKDVVEHLLAHKDIDPNLAEKKYGLTPLYIATIEDRKNIVELLLGDTRTDINQARTDNGATPLFIAAKQGLKQIVEILLAHKDIDPNLARKYDGATPLKIALFKENLEIATMLINAGVDCSNIDTQEKQQILDYFISNQPQQDLNEILRFFGKINMFDWNDLDDSALLSTLQYVDEDERSLLFAGIYKSSINGDIKKEILLSLIGNGHSFIAEYVKNPLERYITGHVSTRIYRGDEDFDENAICEAQYRYSEDQFSQSFNMLYEDLVRAEFQYLSGNLNTNSSNKNSLSTYNTEGQRPQKRTRTTTQSKITKLLSNHVLSFIFYTQIITQDSLEVILNGKFDENFNFNFLLDLDPNILLKEIIERFKEYVTFLEISQQSEADNLIYEQLFRMGIGKGSEDLDTLAKFLLKKQLQTILNSHQIANITLAGIALDSRNLKAFECNYEDLTKLKLLLDIKLSMDKHGVKNIEKEFSDRDNSLYLYDEVGKPIYPAFEYKDTYIFQTYDGVLEIISAEQSKALEIDEIPLEFLKEFSKEIKDELEKKHSGEYDTNPAKRQRTEEEDMQHQRLHALACNPGNGLNIFARG